MMKKNPKMKNSHLFSLAGRNKNPDLSSISSGRVLHNKKGFVTFILIIAGILLVLFLLFGGLLIYYVPFRKYTAWIVIIILIIIFKDFVLKVLFFIFNWIKKIF